MRILFAQVTKKQYLCAVKRKGQATFERARKAKQIAGGVPSRGIDSCSRCTIRIGRAPNKPMRALQAVPAWRAPASEKRLLRRVGGLYADVKNRPALSQRRAEDSKIISQRYCKKTEQASLAAVARLQI